MTKSKEQTKKIVLSSFYGESGDKRNRKSEIRKKITQLILSSKHIGCTSVMDVIPEGIDINNCTENVLNAIYISMSENLDTYITNKLNEKEIYEYVR